jgi:predicted patatin/cPLA2 family phospholipase
VKHIKNIELIVDIASYSPSEAYREYQRQGGTLDYETFLKELPELKEKLTEVNELYEQIQKNMNSFGNDLLVKKEDE